MCIAIVTMLLLVCATFTVFAEETDEYKYDLRDGKAVLTEYIKLPSETIVEVPNEIDGHMVIGLDGTFKENQHIEEVIIPDGVEFLGDETFSRCRNLCYVDLPDSIKKFGWKCFQYSGLKTVKIPASMEEIGLMNFYSCENLESVDFGDSKIKKICNGAFNFCVNIKRIDLPKSLEIIDESPFIYCNSIEEFIITENVKTINIGLYPVVSGESLKKIINLSAIECDKDIFDCKEDEYAWFTTENGYELAEYIPSNAIIYRRKKDSAQKYLDEYLKMFQEYEISMEVANTEEEILEYVWKNKPDTDLDSIKCEIKLREFSPAIKGDKNRPEGYNGYALVRIEVNNEKIERDDAAISIKIDIKPISYSYNPDDFIEQEYAKEYAEKYKEVLDKLYKKGIDINIANTPEEVKNYIISLAPDGRNENLEVDVRVQGYSDGSSQVGEFVQAVNGTASNKNGKRGSAGIIITVKNTLVEEDFYEVRKIIYIIPEKYSYTSSDDSSDSYDDEEENNSYKENQPIINNADKAIGTEIKNEIAKEGTWIKEDGKWRFIIKNGLYAYSQWIYLNGKTYLVGKEGFMLTGWQQLSDGTWYLFDNINGDMKTGW